MKLQNIKKERFEAFVAYTRNPLAAGIISKELEWYASDNEILLATIIVDIDKEFAVIILGRDRDLKYHCINSSMIFENIEDARKFMFSESEKIFKEGNLFYSNDHKVKQKHNLFDIICDKEKINLHFEKVSSSEFYSSAKEIIEEIMHHYKDIDGNFIEQFQTTGFDARLWELYLFVYLTEERLLINREYEAPDFLVSKGTHKIAIEAVTVNDDSKIDANNLTPENIKKLLQDYMPLKFGSSLTSKLNKTNKKGKHYWEMEHVKDCPFLLAIADFHALGSMSWSSTALPCYLYGKRYNWHISDDGQLLIIPIETDFTKESGKKINGFFSLENSENISAVLFSASGTISKFVRMGKIAGFGNSEVNVKYGGVCHNHESLTEGTQFFFDVNNDYKELWGAGISVFHNPNAINPLSKDIFPSVAHFHMLDDGKIVAIPPKFHPYTGMTYMHSVDEEVTQDSFESLFTTFSTN